MPNAIAQTEAANNTLPSVFRREKLNKAFRLSDFLPVKRSLRFANFCLKVNETLPLAFANFAASRDLMIVSPISVMTPLKPPPTDLVFRAIFWICASVKMASADSNVCGPLCTTCAGPPV
ncbi:MAG: hypothetical protein JXA33_01715 [Anaerolineae bacterium]|nr:hypothetical protein [Anaerolineae bacterium]